MNKQQRNQWDKIIQAILDDWIDKDSIDFKLLLEANTHILKLERELQNIKGGRKVAAILVPKTELGRKGD